MWQRIKNIYHLGIAILANLFYGFPSRKIKVIGVTGTDGKTTTASLIYHILNAAGFNASMVTSVGAVINGKKYDVGFHVTTPSSFALQKFFKKALSSHRQPRVSDDARLQNSENQSLDSASLSKSRLPSVVKPTFNSSVSGLPRSSFDYLVLETTSHALDQFRVFGIEFDIGVLTNVTHEHLDYHKTYESYVETKTKLLKMSRVAIVNRDDESYGMIKDKGLIIKNKINLVTYGMRENADINPKTFPFKTNLIGVFNKYNILAAIAVCKTLGVSSGDIRKGIASFVPPLGREDIIYQKDFTVMIDFAHTPNAINQILKSIKPNVKGKIIHVFGSAGERDRTKRPIMGKMSSQYSDIIILTSEDPRSESVEEICDEIESGITNHELRIIKIPDRKKAIAVAIKMARKGDFVLITGKSHERSMNYGHGEVPWDEYGVVREGLRIRD